MWHIGKHRTQRHSQCDLLVNIEHSVIPSVIYRQTLVRLHRTECHSQCDISTHTRQIASNRVSLPVWYIDKHSSDCIEQSVTPSVIYRQTLVRLHRTECHSQCDISTNARQIASNRVSLPVCYIDKRSSDCIEQSVTPSVIYRQTLVRLHRTECHSQCVISTNARQIASNRVSLPVCYIDKRSSDCIEQSVTPSVIYRQTLVRLHRT